MFTSYNPNRSCVMVRNPYFKQWSKAAQPAGYPDEITYSFGLTVEAQITEIQNGQADWTLEAPPADRLGELGTKYASQVHVNTADGVLVRADEHRTCRRSTTLKARQAVNYAIDRNAAVKIFGGPRLATPSCQVLPPGFPGHATTARTRRTRARSGRRRTSRRRSSSSRRRERPARRSPSSTPDDEVNKAMGVYLQSVLNQIGYKAR